MKQFEQEVQAGERFEFGSNWKRFLKNISDDQINRAVQSLQEMLELQSLRGLRFLDIGCGSGLFSLAARKLGASVHSLDYDPNSVGCAMELRQRYFQGDRDPDWVIEQGSALDRDYIKSLGEFDIVYSWGVLHHTGSMWLALENAVLPVKPGGRLFVSIYNDQGVVSKRWTAVKRMYNRSSAPVKQALAAGVLVQQWWRPLTKDLILLRPFASWRNYSSMRGMTPWRDVIDWVGGFPFEVASPEQIFDFYRKRGFQLTKLTTCRGTMGCNEFVFVRSGAAVSAPDPQLQAVRES